ncbi:MAG: ATP-grasp domain-containing protein [Candidatus Aminicenantales bacterium]
MKKRNLLIGIAFNAYDPVIGKPVERESDESIEQTAREVLEAVTELGYSAFVIPLQKSFMNFLQRIRVSNADVVINLCEAFLGRAELEANVAAALELLDVPFTGNGSHTLAICQNKFKTKAILSSWGLPTAPGQLITSPDQKIELPFPLIVKPNSGDASEGIHPDSVVQNEESLQKQVQNILKYFQQPALVEAFIDGREFNVAVIENHEPRALPVSEIEFREMPKGVPHICSYEAKWFEDHVLYKATPPVCPAKIDDSLRDRLQETALSVFQVMGCQDYARVDFRMAKDGQISILEVNPNPDISLNAGYARALKASGKEYKMFWEQMVANALKRKEKA